ncbi:BMP family ABC transporter substrate-binding protein [Rhodoferax koreense]|uniref:BMP family ABC transporter substrate-binding protein n=1 Tax=Rhodoferax koreensis TaxID=1842727 RepID=A0A1P8JY85_9BURK|nr:BMP family protein [Rhodoferax koreense]APW38641.1 BMP family ABC transporter substrate-binding protein [Rhodoferax koreense]
MNFDPTRRQLALGASALLAAPFLPGCASQREPRIEARTLSVGALFAGRMDDRGFMESGWRGLERARTELGAQTRYIDGIAPRKDLLEKALAELVSSGVDLVIAHGGQNNEACAEVAAQFPRVKFAVTQGAVTGVNLASYEVLQEESAYLAGVLAALTTRTGVVGHMSGIRVRPGLKGRAAFAAGVRATDPQVRLLTNFSGNQDDNALSRRVALAQMAAGADVIFTMLNAGRDGVTQACREKGTRQIGNVVDWTAVDAKVFVGSAIADVGIGVFEAVHDLRDDKFPAGKVRKVGLANAQAVRLAMAPDVPASVRARVAQVADDIVQRRTGVPETYEGAEFATPA